MHAASLPALAPVLAVVLAIALVPAPGCRRPRGPSPPPPAAAEPDPAARLASLVQEHVDASLAASPITATWLGAHRLDDRLDDLSPEALAHEQVRLRYLLERAQGVPESALDEARQVDRALLLRDVRLRLFELVELRPHERNPVRYLDLLSASIDELLATDFAPLPDRLRSATARISRFRPFLDEARRNLRTPAELQTRRAIELGQDLRSFVADTLPRVVNAAGDDRLQADFRAAQADALRVLDDFLGFLQRDLLGRSRGDLALGRERLLERLRIGQSLELSDDPRAPFPGSLVTPLEREVRVAARRLDEAARQVAPGKSSVEALRLLEEDHPAAEQLLPATGALLDQLLAFARERHLEPVPARPAVVEMPPYLWGYALGSAAGPLEADGRERVYIDPVNRSWDRKAQDEHLRAFNRAQLALTLAHAVLGHQALLAAQRRAPSPMQRFSADPAFVDGWATLVDQVLVDEGFAPSASLPAATDGGAVEPAPTAPSPEARLRLAQRREVAIQLCRLLGGLRFHAGGARLDDVAQLFESVGLEPAAARREAERVATNPAELEGGLGYLVLARLRDEERKARGDAFDPADLGSRLLAHGALPLGLARRLVLKERVTEVPLF